MKDIIVVVGGYGQAGCVVCRLLGRRFPGRVYAAGRSLAKAAAFASSTDGDVLPLQMDVRDGSSVGLPEGTGLVVMCLDQDDTSFVARCLELGVHYVDISASAGFLARVRKLGGEGKGRPRSTAVLSVGLAPGLTNLLVKRCVQSLDEVRSADIFLMLGLGDKHGRAAIEWMADNMEARFNVTAQGGRTEANSFEDGKKTAFPGIRGRRMAYRFPFADQFSLPDTLGIRTVSTRICFDSRSATRLLAAFKKAGAFRLLRCRAVRRAAVRTFERLRWGSDVCVAKASAEGTQAGRPVRYECSVRGRQEHAVTGAVAAAVAERLYVGVCPPGVYHIEELFEPMELIGGLEERIEFEEGWYDPN
ncbi:saccharopine dehydrogenase family protein [Paenibacillus flagellatus]|uniref:Saccharopine dehydrogenase n=1 Tax=Paenibacillus flagellatus TaxID=2211139 RepID=A0A2V5KHJ0_9BACL|nr:saccharopine dehydrogenase NADP-binding domain-containing protein [Paenibacillus flagellatus]PYI53810.1 Saccharopine dehydrogenase [Paenibacillus flagellatus]